jgi:uroporphyrinogen-III synthase
MRNAITLLLAPCLASWSTVRPHAVRARVVASAQEPAFLTREDGKNDKLRKLLEARHVACEELPCIAFERLPGVDDLCTALQDRGLGCIVLTSPEAATVFLDAWRAAGAPSLAPLATVGAGTSAVLSEAGLAVAFEPSKATGKTLAAELPPPDGAALYPASALASDAVEGGLKARGISTQRIDTYTTVAAEWDASALARAQSAAVVTFASPSAVRVWAEKAGTSAAAVCIGETSAAEARRVGFADVRCPDSPGVAAWADAVCAYFGASAVA